MFFYFFSFVLSSKFAILYAGSSFFFNYRHQADIFTIYNQLLARGFTSSNINLLAYDDIATDPDNIYQGQVFHTLDHKTNVYPGSSAINVKGLDVNPQAFYDAITGVPTTNDDYVFIYYDNHGSYGHLGTPAGEMIYVDDLMKSLNKASESKLYKKLLFIIEACFSGSIGEYLTDAAIPDIAMITAANSDESSYAAVYDEELGTFLSNEFTNIFISAIDERPDMLVGELFDVLEEQTKQSHACFFGDESVQSLPLSAFIGTPNKVTSHNDMKCLKAKPSEATEKTLSFLSKHPKASIRARARLQLLKLRAQTMKLETALDLIVKYVDPANYDKIMNDTKSKVTPEYLKVLRVFMNKIGEINPDDYGKLKVIKALASSHSKDEIIQGIFAVL